MGEGLKLPNRLSKVVKKAAPAKKQKPVPVKIVSDTAMNSPKVDDGWRVRDALSTLSRADEIKRDRSLMKQVKAEAKKQVKSLSNVCK
jgi:hypothetical protein